MRGRLVVMSLLLLPLTPASAQVIIQFGLPSVSIGFSQLYYPQMVRVPGYPVYYDPYATSNYFFYDGMYWVYEHDGWYVSTWYNGPWSMVAPYSVPSFLLRVPVQYYRHPPAYFRGWHRDAPPRWGERWGQGWERQRGGWDRWDRRHAPAPAPLPVYQRQYLGGRYPDLEQQRHLHEQHYRHQPSDQAVMRTYQEQYRRSGPPQPQHGGPSHGQAEPGGQAPHMQQQPGSHMQQPPQRPPPSADQHTGHDQGQQKGNEKRQEHDR